METIVGTLESIEEKPSGWFDIKIGIGRQYPVKLATKKQELVELARAAGENTMVWSYNEQESDKINEHTGKPFVNRYFEGVEPADPAASPDGRAAAKDGSGEALSKEEWRRKDSAADLRACIAISAGVLTHTMPSEPTSEQLKTVIANVLNMATAWHRVVSAERDGEEIPF